MCDFLKYTTNNVRFVKSAKMFTILLFLQLFQFWCSQVSCSETSTTNPVLLRTCCSFQSQYNLLSEEDTKGDRCSNSTGVNNVSFPTAFKVPRYLSMTAYNEVLTNNVEFKLIPSTETPECEFEQFELTASLDSSKSNNGEEAINFTIEGYVKYGKEYFAPNEYCINKLTNASISLIICKSNENCNFSSDGATTHPGRHYKNPCIRRCCDFGEVYDLSNFARIPKGRLECKPSGEKQWKPILYDEDPYTLLDKQAREENQEIQPHFITSHPRDGWCDPTNAVIISLNDKYEQPREIVRILKDGSFLRKTQAQTWIKLDKEHFCIDGGQNYPGYFDLEHPGYFTGDGQDTIILDCTPEFKDQSGVANAEKIYRISMIISSIFLLLTVIVYFLLWEKQNVHGWTILCYAMALFLAYIFMVFSKFAKELNISLSTSSRGSTGSFCRIIAVAIHFFFVSTFCWLTMINFDLWWTFKVLKPTSGKSKGLKRFILYTIFSLGIPAVFVSVGLALDFTYRDDIDSDVIIPLYGQSRCHLNGGKPMMVYLYGPIGLLLGINFLFFLFTIYSMYKIQQSTKFASTSSSKTSNKQNQSVKLFLKLFIIMGVSWIFEVISWSVSGFDVAWYWIIFDLFNIFQAVLIFIIFVCKKETVASLEQKYPSFKRFTNSVKMESSTYDKVTKRYPKLRGDAQRVLSPFSKTKAKGPGESSNSHPTEQMSMSDTTSAVDGGETGGGGSKKGQKFPMTKTVPQNRLEENKNNAQT